MVAVCKHWSNVWQVGNGKPFGLFAVAAACHPENRGQSRNAHILPAQPRRMFYTPVSYF
jgi:hypothetical protein